MPESTKSTAEKALNALSGDEIARKLMDRLLEGERGQLPLYLAMLLEKSSPLDHGEEHYRAILPANLVGLKLTSHAVRDITDTVCQRIAEEPDSDLLFAVAMTGSEQVTRLAVDLLIEPPRPLTTNECGQALGILDSYLSFTLARNRDFIPAEKQKALARILKSLQSSHDVSIQGHAQRLSVQLGDLGVETC